MLLGQDTHILESYADCDFFVVCFSTSGFILRPFSYPFSPPVTDLVLDYYFTVPSEGFLKNICAAQKCVHSRLLRTSLCDYMILF